MALPAWVGNVDGPEQRSQTMRVKDVMTTAVITATPETPLREAARVLTAHGVSGLPVLAADGRVIGVLSESDIVAKERRRPEDHRRRFSRRTTTVDVKHEARTVGDAMTSPAVTTASFVTVASAAARMIEHGINRLPVVDRDQLIGIVSRADLVRAFARSDDEIAADAREMVALQQEMAGDPHVVAIDVADGDVVLTGTVRRRSDAELLPTLVRQVPGVVEVRADLSWSETD